MSDVDADRLSTYAHMMNKNNEITFLPHGLISKMYGLIYGLTSKSTEVQKSIVNGCTLDS